MQVEKLRKSDTHARNWVDYQNLYSYYKKNLYFSILQYCTLLRIPPLTYNTEVFVYYMALEQFCYLHNVFLENILGFVVL